MQQCVIDELEVHVVVGEAADDHAVEPRQVGQTQIGCR